MDKTTFTAWERAFPQKKTLFEASERQIAEMADLRTAFRCVLTHFRPRPGPY